MTRPEDISERAWEASEKPAFRIMLDFEAQVLWDIRPTIARAIDAETERAAVVAKDWLDEWASDLYATFESYVEAQNSGRHSGRSIPKDMARQFAREFRERAEAVGACADQVAQAIRSPHV